MGKTHWKKIVSNPEYLGEADFDENEEKIGTIAGFKEGVKVRSGDGSSDTVAVIYFAEPGLKPMTLNVAKSKAIEKVCGSPYMEDWPGHAIQLYIEHNVKAFGTTCSAVRVRPRAPQLRAACKCSRCGKDILGASGKSAEYIAAYTAKKFGAQLCFDCATGAAKPAQEVTEDAPAETDQQ